MAREFVLSAGLGIWGEAVDPAADEGLRLIAERAGLDWPGCQAALGDAAIAERIEDLALVLEEAGLQRA